MGEDLTVYEYLALFFLSWLNGLAIGILIFGKNSPFRDGMISGFTLGLFKRKQVTTDSTKE